MNPRHFRIFVASPGDVTHERELALTVLDQLQYEPSLRGRITIEQVAWDKRGAGAPILANLTPQESIKIGLPKPSDCDIVIVIFWSRMGTPLPPDHVKKDGSSYNSGTEWEYEDAINASEASGRPQVLLYRRTEPVLLNPEDPEFDEKTNQYKLVRTFFGALTNPDRSIKRGYNSYQTPGDFKQFLEHHLKSIIERLLREPTQSHSKKAEVPPPWPTSPFPGLRAFTIDDAPIFFGRERETDALSKRIEENQVVAIVGASGSGKSSLAGAGLIPRLVLTSGRQKWILVKLTPDYLGSGDPFAAVSASLFRDLPGFSASHLATSLSKDPDHLARVCLQAIADSPDDPKVLIFIDQFEELFTTVIPTYRQPFVDMIANASTHSNIRFLITLRGDFYGRCVELPQLAKLLEGSTYPLSVPGMAALYEMITRPASRADLQFEDGLAQRILDDTGDEPGSLALMAYTLDELYRSSADSRRLLHAAYEELEGVQGAIGKRSEIVFLNLNKRQQQTLPLVFRELVEVDERGTATRKRESLVRVTNDRDALRLIKAFTDARLLVLSRGENNEPYVEVAHEALFRSWQRLAEWIKDTQDDLRLLRQVRTAAQEWDRNGRRDDFLWSQERLEPVFGMRERLKVEFDPVVQEFARPEGERLLEELKFHRKYHKQRPLIERLAEIGEPSLPFVVQGLPFAVIKSAKRDIHDILQTHRSKAVPLLVAACSAKDSNLRASAAEALSQLPDRSALTALVKLSKDKSRRVRMHSAVALGKLGGSSVARTLQEGVEDTDPIVQRICLIELATLGDATVLPLFRNLLSSPISYLREVSAQLLGFLGSVKAEPVRYSYNYKCRELVKLSSSEEDIYDYLEHGLQKIEGKLRDDVVALTMAALLQTLDDDEPRVRLAAAKALRKIAHSNSISALSLLLSDEVTEIREEATKGLGNIVDESVVPVLVNALLSSFSDVRSAAATALGELGYDQPNFDTRSKNPHFGKLSVSISSSSARDVLLELLNDSEIKVRRSAAKALGSIRLTPALAPLIAALQDRDQDLRSISAESLGRFGDISAAPALIEALKDGSGHVVHAAALSLGELRSTLAKEPLINLFRRVPKADYWETTIKAAALTSLGRILGDDAIDILVEALQNSEWTIRRASQEALVLIGTPKALEVLSSL